ncbi:MAG: amidohydrolase [Burkholderiaceae bacterium]
MTTTVFRARAIHTMDPVHPRATHVAVRDGRVLGVGTPESLRAWGPFELDERFAERVLLPGFVEAHCHVTEGTSWRRPYCGFHDRVDPDGRRWPGALSIDDVVARLDRAQAGLPGPDAPLIGWGFDPIHLPGGRRCRREDLDRVSERRPVGLAHASGHVLNVNTAGLRALGWLDAPPDHPGVARDAAGVPTGELFGPEVMTPMLERLGIDRGALSCDEAGLRAFGRLCVRTGVTTATELSQAAPDALLDPLAAIVGAPDFPTRIVWAMHVRGQTVEQAVSRAKARAARSTERLRLGVLKVHVDGSMQGFTARLRWPHYLDGRQGLWYVEPEYLEAVYEAALREGVQVHTHTNGDEATELALDCFERARRRAGGPDHRFVLQHCQMADAAQLRRMAALGLGANFFANHCYYWGDQHYEVTLGPDRAERIDACRTALETGVPFAIHSDAPVTPIGPLFSAWCAVNRVTASGRVLGAHERIGVDDALRAITLGAAWTLRLDGEIGSIATGKRADFAVLDDDPYELPPERLKDARAWGVVQGGRVFAAPAAPRDAP